MSEPLSTTEIEDVVSSVRRLVSTEQRPRPLTRDIAPDKLLLTPSLRVVADNAAMMPLILTDAVAEANPSSPDDRLHLVEAEWEDEIWAAPGAPLAEMALGAEEAEVLTADPATPWPEVESAAPDSAATVWPEAETEAAMAGDWSDDGSVAALQSGDVGAGKAGANEAQDDDLDVAEVLTAAVVEDEAFQQLNQTELHALVRAMVREELQGNLGERITRNVRKLVRAEINRALAARDLG